MVNIIFTLNSVKFRLEVFYLELYSLLNAVYYIGYVGYMYLLELKCQTDMNQFLTTSSMAQSVSAIN